jgi:hypothetical protein
MPSWRSKAQDQRHHRRILCLVLPFPSTYISGFDFLYLYDPICCFLFALFWFPDPILIFLRTEVPFISDMVMLQNMCL